VTTIDERVAYLEGKVDEHSSCFSELRDSVRQVDQKLDRLFASLNDRIVGVDQKVDRLDDKMSRQFLWILGVQVAVLIAVVSALAGG
jgi:uncharacterized coiled-coil protein SlyX